MDSTIKIKRLHKDATFEQKTAGAVGYDLTCVGYSFKDGNCRLHLGVSVQPPHGMWFMLAARSSFAKSGWIVSNGIGIVDPDYTGEWMMLIAPNGVFEDEETDGVMCRVFHDIFRPEQYFVGQRVAQAIPMMTADPLKHLKIEEVPELDRTDRGTGGFGSTGS